MSIPIKTLKGLIILAILLIVATVLIKKTYQSKQTTEITKDIKTHETVTTIVTKRGSKTTTTRDIIDKTKIEKEFIIMPRKAVLSVSLLASVDSTARVVKPIYGINVSKEVFGPFTAGAFGLTNGIVGLSVGINF